jgi:hypothetical protein
MRIVKINNSSRNRRMRVDAEARKANQEWRESWEEIKLMVERRRGNNVY